MLSFINNITFKIQYQYLLYKFKVVVITTILFTLTKNEQADKVRSKPI